MRRIRHQILAVFCLLLAGTVPALAAKRAALVVGNASYQVAGILANPVNDAQLVADALRRANFETVDIKINLGMAEFRQALRRFQTQADGAEVALIYFAGHGIEARGANWLIPTDAELNLDRDLEYEAIRLDLALDSLTGARKRILILDACRNNPFGRKWQSGSRNLQRGLGPLETDDVLILFAAAPGQTASDGGAGSNSPFATALAKRLPEPGLIVQLLGGRVRDDVLAATGGAQRPFVSASISGEPFYLIPPETVAPKEGQPSTSEAAQAWSRVQDSTSREILEAFRKQYGRTNPFFDALAAQRIAALAKPATEGENRRLPVPDRSCALERRVKSMPAQTATTISFKNSTASVLHIFWIDHDGERKLYASLQTGQSHTQKTFMAHPWLVTDAGQRCLGVFMPQANGQEHEVR